MLALEKGAVICTFGDLIKYRYRNEPCRSKVKGCCDKDSLFAP